MNKNEKFAALISEANKKENESPPSDDLDDISIDIEDNLTDEEDLAEPQRRISTISAIHKRPLEIQKSDEKRPNKDLLIKAETILSGGVKRDVYWIYIQAATVWLSGAFVAFYVAYAGLQLGRSIWLSAWSDDSQMNGTMSSGGRMGVYAGIGVVESGLF